MWRLGLILVVAGCGPGSFEEFRDQYVARLCDNARHCGDIGRDDPCPLPAWLPSAAELDVPSAISDGKLRYDSLRAQECLDALERPPCDPAIVALRIYGHCHNILGPNLETGGTCRDSVECVGGSCDGSFACPGHCIDWPPPRSVCQPGDCDPTVQFCGGDPPLCQPHVGETGHCTADDECDYPFVCVNGKCGHHPRVGDGQACGFPQAVCDDDRYCAPTGGVCTGLRSGGSPCDAREGCTRDNGCAGADGGICRHWADEGQPCTTGLCPLTQICAPGSDGGDSDAGLSGSCRADPTLPAGPHESCASRKCAEGLFCGGGQSCEYLRLLGGNCSPESSGCAPGLTCDPSNDRCKPPSMVCATPDGGARD